MVVLENGFLKNQFAIYYDGEKSVITKRFLVETENKKELIITDIQIHNGNSTDYRPVVELVFKDKRSSKRSNNSGY
jgi:hypothetical protein